MTEIFFTTLSSNTLALIQVLLIALTGAVLVRTRVFKSGDVKGLTMIVINVLLPSMIFSKIVSSLNPQTFPLWWVLPLVGIGLILIGVVFAILFFFPGSLRKKKLITNRQHAKCRISGTSTRSGYLPTTV